MKKKRVRKSNRIPICEYEKYGIKPSRIRNGKPVLDKKLAKVILSKLI